MFFNEGTYLGRITGVCFQAFVLIAALTVAAPLPALAADEVDFGGFIRLRQHTSDYATYNAGQIMPPNKLTDGDSNVKKFFEQRARLYIRPKVGEYLTGNFAFEIDGRWGDVAYSTGRGAGFGLNADSTNLETKNLNFTVRFPETDNSAIIGLQTIADPYGGILLGWADAGGITYIHKSEALSTTLGYYRFWQPSGTIKQNSNVDFLRAEAAYSASDTFKLGFNLHVILDNSGEEAGSTGALGGDPIGSPENGFAPLAYNVSTGNESLVGATNYTMNLFMPGVNFEADLGGISAGGFFIYEFGWFDSKTDGVSDVDHSSFAGELHAATTLGGFNVKLSGLYVAGDSSSDNSGIGVKKGGFYTPGSFSLAGAWMGLTGMKILFEDIDGTTQDAYLVYDVTNIYEQQPLGVMAAMLTANTKLADKVRLELGLGILLSAEDRVVNGENSMATELNASVHYDMIPGVTFGVVAAYAAVGDFYGVSAEQAAAYNDKAPGIDVSAYDPEDMWKVTLRAQYSF